jgi:hypothetical protein
MNEPVTVTLLVSDAGTSTPTNLPGMRRIEATKASNCPPG